MAVPPASEVPPVYYTLGIEGRDLGAEIFLNDVLVDTVDGAERASASTTINAWLVPGTNRLRIRSTLSHAGASPPAIEARISKRGADNLGDPEALATLHVAPTRPDAIVDETTTFKVDPAPPAELWTGAQPIRLDGAARAACGQIVRDLERGFARKDVTAVTALLAFKTADTARASFRDQELAMTTLREQLDTLFTDPGYTVDYLTPEALVFEVCANQRLLRVARPTGPALQIRLSQGGRFRLSPLLAKLDGKPGNLTGGSWKIAR